MFKRQNKKAEAKNRAYKSNKELKKAIADFQKKMNK